MWITDGWDALSFHDTEVIIYDTKVSIIIAARNEEKYISDCLTSILNNCYPSDLLEVIVVDDLSTDNTFKIVAKNFPTVNLLQTSSENTGKKSAIKLASKHATGDLLIFTDADCIVTSEWIANLVRVYVTTPAKFIAAPIQIALGDDWLSRFQFLDVSATMAVTGAGIYYQKFYAANGANMAVDKNAFLALYDIRKDEHLASGDDMFAIQYLATQNVNNIHFLKSNSATVTTKGESTLSDFIVQRKRWAGKSKHYPTKGILYIQGFVFLFVALITLNIIFGMLTNGFGIFIAALMIFIKVIIDYLFLSKIVKFFNQQEALKNYLLSALIYNIYILWAGAVAMIPTSYNWKDRSVN